MASTPPKMMIYTIEDDQGNQYDIEGPEGVSEEELFAAIADVPPPTEAPASSPEGKTLGSVWDRRLSEAQGEQPGIDPDNYLDRGGSRQSSFIGETYIPNPLKTVEDAYDLVAHGGEYAGAVGNTALELLDDFSVAMSPGNIASNIFGTKDYTEGNEVRLGSMIGALGEGFPAGLDGVIANLPNTSRWSDATYSKFKSEVDEAMNTEGTTRADFDEITERYQVQPLGEDLDEALRNRDRGGATAHLADYEAVKGMQNNLQAEADAFLAGRKPTDLEVEAQNFEASPEPTIEDTFRSPERIARDEAEMAAKLEQEAAAFMNRQEPEVDPFAPRTPEVEAEVEVGAAEAASTPEAPAPTPEPKVAYKDIENKIYETIDGWKNSPSFVAFDDLDEAVKAQLDPTAKAVILPDGTVTIMAHNIEDISEVPAIVYHEALGHGGMTQLFGKGLDDQLIRFYDNSPDFKEAVDEWIKKRPGAYEGQNIVARAADEVLAEMSEASPMKAAYIDRVKNFVKSMARRAGMKNVEYSTREINTILAMAHDAVINGKPNNVAGNGFRYRLNRRAASQAATRELEDTLPGETRVTQPFPLEEPDYYRFRHVDDNGNSVTGFYTVSDGALDNFSVSSEGGPGSIGPATMRQVGRQLLEQHPEASSINGFRISGARTSPEFVSGARYMAGKTKKSMSPEKMNTVNDVDDVLDFIHSETDRPMTKSDAEVLRTAKNFGLTSGKYLKGKNLYEQELAAKVEAAGQLLTNLTDELGQLETKVRKEGMTPSTYMNIQTKLATMRAVYARFDEDTGELGRAFRILQRVRESTRSQKAAERYMKEAEALGDGLDNPDVMMRYLQQVTAVNQTAGPGAAAQFIRNSQKLRWEDYADSLIANGMLSSPKTWMINFVGSPLRYGLDTAVDAGAALLGQLRRGNPSADRVLMREVLGRIMGPVSALGNFSTYKNIWEAVRTGESGHAFGRKISSQGLVSTRMPSDGLMKTPVQASLKAGMSAWETPRRVMAGTDELWRNLLVNGHVTTEAMRRAAKTGKTGQDFWDEVETLVSNPPADLLTEAQKRTSGDLFNDTPSKITQRIMDVLQTRYADEIEVTMQKDSNGKFMPTAKKTKDAHGMGARMAKFGLRSALRFMPTLDSITRYAIKNSGPAAILSGEIRQSLRAGGAARDSAVARIAMSSSLMTYFAIKTMNGELTGAGDPDPEKQAALGAVSPPMSIKIGNEWVSYQGLDPLSSLMLAPATAVERSGGSLEVTNPETYANIILGIAEALKSSSYAQSIGTILEATNETADNLKEHGLTTEAIGPSLSNLVGGQVSAVVNPNFARWVNQEFLDPSQRDTVGDRSAGDRFYGRIAGGTPGLSDELPGKYDVYGRPVLNARQERLVEEDPVVLELNRLEKLVDEVLVGAPGARLKDYRTKPEGEVITLNATDRQEYQRISGALFLQDIGELMNEPGWETASDEMKMEAVKELLTEARKETREALFGGTDGSE